MRHHSSTSKKIVPFFRSRLVPTKYSAMRISREHLLVALILRLFSSQNYTHRSHHPSARASVHVDFQHNSLHSLHGQQVCHAKYFHMSVGTLPTFRDRDLGQAISTPSPVPVLGHCILVIFVKSA